MTGDLGRKKRRFQFHHGATEVQFDAEMIRGQTVSTFRSLFAGTVKG
jgi:hypothetical protein